MVDKPQYLQFLKSESDLEVTLEEKPVDVESGNDYFAKRVNADHWYAGIRELRWMGKFVACFEPSIGTCMR